MKRLFNKLDTYLITNKPHIWLTRVHIVLPVAMLLLAMVIIFSGHVRMTNNIYWVLIAGCIASLGLIVALLRFQYLYYNKNFNETQLKNLLFVNLITLLFLLIIAVYIPFRMSSRADSTLEYVNFKDVSDEIRIAMIRSDYITAIRAGMLDSLRDTPVYAADFDLIENLKSNKFITQALTELEFNSSSASADSAVAVVDTTAAIYADTIKASADSVAKYVDTTKGNPYGTKTQNTPAASAGATTYAYNYTDFLKLLRAKTPEEIAFFKRNIGGTIAKYEFTSYGGDSSLSSINTYYDILNKESLNLYSTRTFYSNVVVVFLILFVLLISLAQFSVLLFNKKYTVLLLVSLLLFYCLLGAFANSFVAASNAFPVIGPVYMIAIIILTVIFSKFFAKKPTYSAGNIVAFNLLNFLFIYFIAVTAFLGYLLIYLLFSYIFDNAYLNVENVFKNSDGDLSFPQLILFGAIFFFLLFKTYTRLIRRLNWISALPRG